ncbi:hypothetical protein AVEN_3324-1, partial [Araneus ventricosus]
MEKNTHISPSSCDDILNFLSFLGDHSSNLRASTFSSEHFAFPHTNEWYLKFHSIRNSIPADFPRRLVIQMAEYARLCRCRQGSKGMDNV